MIRQIKISETIQQLCPTIRLGVLAGTIKVESRSEILDREIQQKCQDQALLLGDADAIKKLPVITASRAAYKILGKDPSRYRPSAEALLRRTVQGKNLYEVSNAVDALNLISISTGFSIGGYDLDKVEGEIRLDRGSSEIPYEAIGRGNLNIEFLPVLYDEKGPFGSPTSDSVRTAVSRTTSRFMMVFFDFDSKGPLADVLDKSQMVFETHVYGKDFESFVFSF